MLSPRVVVRVIARSQKPGRRRSAFYRAAADVARLPALLNRILAGSDEPRRCCPVVFANRVQVRTKGGIPKIRAFIREQRRENWVHGAVVEIEVTAGASGKGELARRGIYS